MATQRDLRRGLIVPVTSAFADTSKFDARLIRRSRPHGFSQCTKYQLSLRVGRQSAVRRAPMTQFCATARANRRMEGQLVFSESEQLLVEMRGHLYERLSERAGRPNASRVHRSACGQNASQYEHRRIQVA